MGIVWYQGEAQTRVNLEATILHYPENLRTTFSNIITSTGAPANTLKVIGELHEQPDSSYPLWPFMQWMQRQMCVPNDLMTIANAIHVSAADQNATIDDGLHLTDGALGVVALRCADALADALT
jgi:hypothetical protein